MITYSPLAREYPLQGYELRKLGNIKSIISLTIYMVNLFQWNKQFFKLDNS